MANRKLHLNFNSKKNLDQQIKIEWRNAQMSEISETSKTIADIMERDWIDWMEIETNFNIAE